MKIEWIYIYPTKIIQKHRVKRPLRIFSVQKFSVKKFPIKQENLPFVKSKPNLYNKVLSLFIYI